jgi:hypothetical protein
MNVTGRGEGVVERGGLHCGGDCDDVGCPSLDDGTTNQGPATACHAPSEVQNMMIIMGHQILSCHVLVVRSFFIL